MMIRTEKNTEQVFNMWRGSIHDYKHKIFAIRHWLEEGNVDNVKEFVEYECENLTQKMFYVQTGNSAVDSIINTKQKIAEDKGIIFRLIFHCLRSMQFQIWIWYAFLEI